MFISRRGLKQTESKIKITRNGVVKLHGTVYTDTRKSAAEVCSWERLPIKLNINSE